jgi:5-methylcytosine-specific restriction protein A
MTTQPTSISWPRESPPTAHSLIEQVMAEYSTASQTAFAKSTLGDILRHRLPNAVAGLLQSPNYVTAGSAGKGRWAETPWVAVFDPFVTTTATEGYYVVYLFRGDGNVAFLSLNQATTEVRKRVGSRYRHVLEQNALLMRGLLPPSSRTTLGGPIALGGRRPLTQGYEAGNVAAVAYERGGVPNDEELARDLNEMLSLYEGLVSTRDALSEAAQATEDGVAHQTGIEGDRFRWHKRVERNAGLARGAKAVHGTTCQVCGFSFEEMYGSLGAGYIEAHHLVPIAALAKRPRGVNTVRDFAVVCANCHRMLHRNAGSEMTIADLAALVKARRTGSDAGDGPQTFAGSITD